MNPGDRSPSVGVVIAAHGDLAHALRRSAEMIVGEQDSVATVALNSQDSPDHLRAAIREAIGQVDRGAGVIVFVDLFGGTPGNAAALSIGSHRARIVSGVNLPMLLEVLLARSTLALEALAALALEIGVKSIAEISAEGQAQASTTD
ncbi:MAG TPA: PTS sugar transporter subunit IIA [Anaerolineae bacterium]